MASVTGGCNRTLILVGALWLSAYHSAEATAHERRPPAARPSGARLSEILKSYVRWRGGAAFLAMRAVHAVGTQTSQADTGTVERWTSTDGSYRLDLRIGAIRSSLRVSRAGAWKTTFSGQVQALADEEREDAIRDALALLSDMPGPRLGSVAMMADETEAGRRLSVVSVRTGSGDGVD